MTPIRASRRTRLVRIDPDHPAPAVIAEAAAIIRAGGLVVFPTETVYGLGANALDEAAVLSVFAAKERAHDDPLIVHIASPADLAVVAAAVPNLARRLADVFWPGPLTIVLPRARAVAPAVSAGLATVAVRMPNHPVALALIRASGVPVAAPSANRFMRTSATMAQHALEDLDGRVDLVLDGGPTRAGIESTVVALDAGLVRILRRGAITREQLERALSEGNAAAIEEPDRTAGLGSPGAMERHYAPRTPLALVTGGGEAARAMLFRLVRESLAAGETPGVLAVDEDAALLRGMTGVRVAALGPGDDLDAIASRLFAAMRELDRTGATALFARAVACHGRGAAVNDRLRRAATRIVNAE